MEQSDAQPPIVRFLVRWLVCGLGLWIAANLLSDSISYGSLGVIVIAGLLLAVLNIILKPILVILSLPAIVLTLGLFMIIINGLTVFIVSKLYAPLEVTNFWAAIFAGMVIGLVNYLVSTILKEV
ncbi:MAG TPA: phage holin family protein [Candidatus Saccharimonadales bacterium]|nr:phage holin family protein [Candidatus Saccharimonadales bacterium]